LARVTGKVSEGTGKMSEGTGKSNRKNESGKITCKIDKQTRHVKGRII
jgi:hypothetical protein